LVSGKRPVGASPAKAAGTWPYKTVRSGPGPALRAPAKPKSKTITTPTRNLLPIITRTSRHEPARKPRASTDYAQA
jgi:hypothetical protein